MDPMRQPERCLDIEAKTVNLPTQLALPPTRDREIDLSSTRSGGLILVCLHAEEGYPSMNSAEQIPTP